MTGITALLLPILLSAVLVFLASFVLHMMLPWHKTDYSKVPDEERFRAAVGALNIPPGDYMVPRPSSPQEMKSPEFLAKVQSGPKMIFTVLPSGPFSMSSNLIQWFLYCVLVGILAGYVAGRALPAGSPYLSVFRFAGVTAFIGYSVALWQNSIWWSKQWSTTIKQTIDGLVYGLLTAGAFGWLWPK